MGVAPRDGSTGQQQGQHSMARTTRRQLVQSGPDQLWERMPTLKSCPHFLRGLRFSFCFVLRERYRAKAVGDVLAGSCLDWSRDIVASAPRMSCASARKSLHEVTSVRSAHRTPPAPVATRTDEEERIRRGVAQEPVMQGQVSRARQALTGAALVPRTLEILE